MTAAAHAGGAGGNLLVPPNIDHLRRFAKRQVLLAFDFDGTLAPLVPDPEAAAPRPETRDLLAALTERFPVAVISGRAVADVQFRLGVSVHAVVGNHGIEPSEAMEEAAHAVATWVPSLRRRLASFPGLVIEDKRYSLALHYQGAPDAAEARRRIHAAIADLPYGSHATDGHDVVNLVLRGAPTKGDALRRLEAATSATGSLFAGDDATDEDAFQAQDPEVSLGVHIGTSRQTRALFHIPSQHDVDALLRVLLDASG
jgi:trehalose 6-phosphate phosphatase